MAPGNSNSPPSIPYILVGAQCVTFALLYGIWALYELLYFRRVLLISGAVLALYPIYQYRRYYLQKRAFSLWLLFGLFVWAIFHLLFLAQDYLAQLMELRRIWKYAGLGAVFAFGLGLSLTSVKNRQKDACWSIIYFGLSLPVLIYCLKYVLTTYGSTLGILTPAFLRINLDPNSAYYVPKTDYIAFCLPVLALSLGQIYHLIAANIRWHTRQYIAILIYFLLISATLFLFFIQNTKNGIAYAAALIALFLALVLLKTTSVKSKQKIFLTMVASAIIVGIFHLHLQKNDSWRTLIADGKIGFAVEQYPHWKFAGEQGYPINEFGKMVSVTNYERASWFRVGVQLASDQLLGYGLVEDSFKRMVKVKWPEASSKLSHSHSGWLDIILGLGLPGFLFIFLAMLQNIRQSATLTYPWKSLVWWALIANIILWVTTEVAATVSFSALIFWISWACGLTLSNSVAENNSKNGLR